MAQNVQIPASCAVWVSQSSSHESNIDSLELESSSPDIVCNLGPYHGLQNISLRRGDSDFVCSPSPSPERRKAQSNNSKKVSLLLSPNHLPSNDNRNRPSDRTVTEVKKLKSRESFPPASHLSQALELPHDHSHVEGGLSADVLHCPVDTLPGISFRSISALDYLFPPQNT